MVCLLPWLLWALELSLQVLLLSIFIFVHEFWELRNILLIKVFIPLLTVKMFSLEPLYMSCTGSNHILSANPLPTHLLFILLFFILLSPTPKPVSIVLEEEKRE